MAISSSLCFSHGFDFASSTFEADGETVSVPNVVVVLWYGRF